MFVCSSHPNAVGLEAAKKLTESLLETVSNVKPLNSGDVYRYCLGVVGRFKKVRLLKNIVLTDTHLQK